MGLLKYTITLECNTPPQVMLGQNIGGGIVEELKEVDIELVTAAQLAKAYNLSVNTVRGKLANINQGTKGKFLYNPNHAHTLLTQKIRRGRPRTN